MSEQQVAPGGTTLLQVVERVLIAVAIAATIGGGSAILSNWNTNSLQDHTIQMLSVESAEHAHATDVLLDELEETQQQLAILNERIAWIINNKEL